MSVGSERRWVGSMPEAYERWLGPTVFRPLAADLARRVAARSPRRILELAAGTGVLTRELVTAAPGAEVVATDLNEAMVEYGRQQVPEAAWRRLRRGRPGPAARRVALGQRLGPGLHAFA